MKHILILYAATLVVMTALDMTWLGLIARDFYRERMSNVEFHAVPGVLFYLIYAMGVVIFVSMGAGLHWQSVLLRGALFGFFCYATYDLTNLATLKGMSLSLALVDMAWGTLVTSLAATAGLLIAGFFGRG